MKVLQGLLLSAGAVIFAALPATDNYGLRDYGFGSGGTAGSGTDNYSVQGIAGELSGQDGSTLNYGLRQGLLGTQLSALPPAPQLLNPSDWYNKLQLTVNTGGNPSDTLFAVAISDDSFATTRYVQSDDTVGPALGTEDFRDYASWGGASGMQIIGLDPDTAYSVKVKAAQGDFTETAYGPQATASTAQVSIVFDIDIAGSDIESAPPYQLAFGSVPPGSVADSPDRIWIDIDSNAESGAFVYAVSENDGLLSSTTNYTISAVTGDLSALGEGLGAQNGSVAQGGGGPLAVASPFDGNSDNVGAIDNQFRQMLVSSAPLDGGRASFLLKLKTAGTTPAANDYQDIYTLIATAAF